jgi:hypothetical protein
MRVVILTPWRTDHNRREAIYQHVRAQQETLGLPIHTADSGHTPFNICASWNQAANHPWDVALFWGADFTLTNPTTALDAAVEAAKGHPYVFAFNTATKLTFKETTRVLDGGRVPGRKDPLPFGGVRAVNRAWWEALGGYDERFQGWGHGDRAFVLNLRKHGGKPSRVPGRLILHRHEGRAHIPNDPYYQHQAENLRLLAEYDN